MPIILLFGFSELEVVGDSNAKKLLELVTEISNRPYRREHGQGAEFVPG